MKRILLSLCWLFLFACEAGPLRPLEPVWGKQPCDHCNMLLSDPLPAGQAVLKEGERKYFDDVGCLAAYLAQPGVVAKAAWVHDASGTHWVDALTARYTGGHRTPMDFGFLAAKSGLTFQEVQAQVAQKTRADSNGRRP